MDKSMKERALDAGIEIDPKFKNLPRSARRRMLRQRLKNIKAAVTTKGMKSVVLDKNHTLSSFAEKLDAKVKEDEEKKE